MADERTTRIGKIFEEALERPPGERRSFLAEACGDDADLRKEVESLLDADSRAGDFMERPVVEHGFDFPVGGQPHDRTKELVGSYRLLRRIGEGGMSEVYLAVRDDDEYEKRVALKIIREGLDSEDMLRRFRTERQILAGLDHPNVAKLLDGGSTKDGLPYFVMDFIEGVPIDEYCDQNRLNLRQRLELFRSVCSAIQYAHQNLVVHRDVKPSNILVTSEGTVKLLDFGIAKLVKPDQFAQRVEYTATWLRPMTPRYASPEQVQGKPVTTASDVYSLGVLLYRMLTGHLPYRLEGHPPTELARLVVEEQAEKPSTAIARADTDPAKRQVEPVSLESVSRARRMQPAQLRRQLSGDLDNIVLMALRKEPQRRYGSVEQLSEDIRRYLSGLPVLARKDTLGYRTAKFLGRHWVGVAVAAAFVVLLVGFAVTMAVQAQRIAHERDQARRERDRAERAVTFLQEIFEVPDPLQGQGENITAREILERGAQRVARELEDQPETQATLLNSIGIVYRNLGLYDRAGPLLEQALDTRRTALGKDPAVAETLMHLGVLERLAGNYDDAERLLRESVELRRELLGEDHQAVGETLNHLGIVLRQKGDYESAREMYDESIRINEQPGGDRLELATAKNNLAALLLGLGRHDEATMLFQEALELRRGQLGSEHPLVAQNLGNIGAALGMQGKYDEAEPFLRESLAIHRKVLEPDHPALIESLNNLAKLLTLLGNLDGAEPLYGEALSIQRRRAGEQHPNVAHIGSNLAELLAQKGDLDGAERRYREALALRREVLGDAHVDTGKSLISLGGLLVDKGEPREAEPLLREGLEVLSASLPEEHWRLAEARSALGASLSAIGRYDEAEPLLLGGFQRLEEQFGPGHRLSRRALQRIVDFFLASGRPNEAARFRAMAAD
jgi:serine/threonine-protein kinase